MINSHAIALQNVQKKFGKAVVHQDISFSVNQGEVVTILGPSGTGKTVILKMMIGLLRPTEGVVSVLGKEIQSMSEEDLRQMRRGLSMLFQGAALFDSLTVFENICYSLREFGEKSEDLLQSIVEEKLEIVGLPGIEQKFPPQLSGGQKKRVGLARALAGSPEIILFDEPTTGLDPTTIRLIDELIIRLRDEFGITSVIVTHDIESARRISDRWILINNGLVVADGSVDDVSNNNRAVHEFISGIWKSELTVSQVNPDDSGKMTD